MEEFQDGWEEVAGEQGESQVRSVGMEGRGSARWRPRTGLKVESRDEN